LWELSCDAAVGGAVITDLRYSSLLRSADSWKMVVCDGILSGAGMVSWAPVMSAEQADTIRHYVIHRANEDKALMAAP
jgi:quinohemoprotein ethanol dehydrogenase